MRYLFLVLSLLACATKPRPRDSEGPKVLHSVWHSLSPNWTMDFTDHDHVKWTYWTGGACLSNSGITWSDDENSGILLVISVEGVNLSPDEPSCDQFIGSWAYQVLPTNKLLLCSDVDCIKFQ